ncbi:MAG: universal stress protein [Polyangiales bacterium]
MIQTMLVAVDDTPRARAVTRRAAELSRSFGAKLILFRAVDVPIDIPAAAHVTPDELERVLVDRAREALTALASELPDARIEVVASGSALPWRAVVEAAERFDVDLIVVGSHGYAGLDHLLGTNAGRIADRARRDVFVVHGVEASGGVRSAP